MPARTVVLRYHGDLKTLLLKGLGQISLQLAGEVEAGAVDGFGQTIVLAGGIGPFEQSHQAPANQSSWQSHARIRYVVIDGADVIKLGLTDGDQTQALVLA
jgi:hypothetical protein